MMVKHTFKIISSLVIFFFFSNFGFSQNQSSFWTLVDDDSPKKVQFSKSIPEKSSFLTLNIKQLERFLETVPKRGDNKSSSKIIDFPNADGSMESFILMESSVMSPELQKKFPNIKSFVGASLKNPSSILRFSISKEKGVSSMLLSEGKTVFIEPYHLENNTYISYINSENDKNDTNFECLTESHPVKKALSDKEFKALKNANDGRLRTYRLALACTVEYAQFHGGTLSDVIAAMNATMTRVNGVFERDLGLTMQMITNEDIIFLGPDPDSDPYTNDDGVKMLRENQTLIDEKIGSANYDIGHVFSTGGGGVATLNSPCTNSKARGVTGSSSPIGDQFDIDYVAHEIGHQFGANHTQNNDCERAAPSVEPGSASTIMGYAGICAPNIQANSDDYFHGESIKEMWQNISQGNSSNCGQVSITGNSPPVAKAGLDYFIPKSTPFILKGSASDPNVEDVLTYSWEQIDRTPAPMPPVSTSTGGPLFRSLPPSTSPDRFMPAFSTVLSGSLSSTWEVLPSVEREMNFLLTVRDNSTLGGNTNSEEVSITTTDGDPFVVQTPPTWPSGSTQTVKWIVGNSDIAPVNCQVVNIYFAEDGVDFSTTLATGIPNSGSAIITLPQVNDTSEARLLVEAADNIFYAVSEPFNIGTSPDFSINAKILTESVCNLDIVSFEFEFVTSNGFSEETEFTVSGPSEANYSITPFSLNSDSSFTLDISNLSGLNAGVYSLEVTATSNSLIKIASVELTIEAGACESVANVLFETSTTGVIINDGDTDILSNLDTGKGEPEIAGYSDYTDMVTELEVNSQYELSVNVNTDGDYFVKTYVWIDWNQNCSFDDPDEQYDLGTARNVENEPTPESPFSFTVPENAVLGNTRMRVTTKYILHNSNQIPLACENDFDGEVEDYTIHVKANLRVNAFSVQDLSIYPNPSLGKFNIQFTTDASTAIQLSVYDLRGRSLVKKNYDVFGKFDQELDLNQLASGVYLLELSDGYRNLTKKIIIQ